MHLVHFDDSNIDINYNTRDPNQYRRVILNQIQQCQSLLMSPEPDNAERLRGDMVSWCRRWDDVYGYDARKIYPEFQEMLDRYGY